MNEHSGSPQLYLDVQSGLRSWPTGHGWGSSGVVVRRGQTDGPQKAELSGLSSCRTSTMGVHMRPHMGVWLWLGVALGLSWGQGKDTG